MTKSKLIKGIVLRRRLADSIGRSSFVRFHMFLILLATAVSGLLISKALLHLGISRMAMRYGIAIGVSYLLFFLFVKLWLMYIGVGRNSRLRNEKDIPDPSWVDLIPTPSGSPQGVGGSGGTFRGFGGGSSGGGGAGGSFTEPNPSLGANIGAVHDVGVTDGVGEVAGEAVGGVLEAEDIGLALAAIILLAALILSTVVVGGYLIWTAPTILADAAFQVLLAASLAGKARHAEESGWQISIFKATWWGFLIVLAFAIAFGIVVQKAIPSATTAKDLIQVFN